jgi:hypothetical protein
MENYTILLLFVSKVMDSKISTPRWKRGDQQMQATILSSSKIGRV